MKVLAAGGAGLLTLVVLVAALLSGDRGTNASGLSPTLTGESPAEYEIEGA